MTVRCHSEVASVCLLAWPLKPAETLLCAWQSDGLDISGSGAHDFRHYRTGKDVVTRLEYISSTQTKASNLHGLPRTAVHTHACTLWRGLACLWLRVRDESCLPVDQYFTKFAISG